MSSSTNCLLGGNHENICEDNGEGNSVCTDCGVILEPVYFYSKKYLNEQTDNETNLCKNMCERKSEVLLQHRKKEIDLIEKLQEKWCFPHYIISETLLLFSQLIKTNKKSRYHKKTIFAFAFHKTLINNNCSHSLYELCSLFEIRSLKVFSKLAFEHQLELPPNINDFLSRFCSNLDFSFQQRKEIFQIFEQIKLPANLKPETICGLIILHYHNKNKTKWNKKEIAKRCEITYQTLVKNYCKFQKILFP